MYGMSAAYTMVDALRRGGKNLTRQSVMTGGHAPDRAREPVPAARDLRPHDPGGRASRSPRRSSSAGTTGAGSSSGSWFASGRGSLACGACSSPACPGSASRPRSRSSPGAGSASSTPTSPAGADWDEAEGGMVWREDRIAELLASPGDGPLYVSGCVSNQGRFYDRFEAVVLLSAPPEVILERIGGRTTNDFGKTRGGARADPRRPGGVRAEAPRDLHARARRDPAARGDRRGARRHRPFLTCPGTVPGHGRSGPSRCA